MPYGTVNADVIQTSTQGGILGAGNASIMKNRIINGAMVINQRAFSGSVDTSGPYTLDRWQANASQASKYTISQSSTAPIGFINSLLVTSSSAYTVGSTDYFNIVQPIEGLNCTDLGWGTANAKTVTLSFWVNCSLTGTFGGAIQNSGNSRSYPFSYTISSANTWTQISVTVAGDTTGTWLTTNGIGINVRINLGLGSTYSGTANTWQTGTYSAPTGAVSVVSTSGATFYITGVQLEVGSSATGFEYRQYGTELSLCQRYYETIAMNSVGVTLPATFYGATNYISQWFFKNTKRTSPTLALVNSATFTATPSNQIATPDSAWLNNTSAFYIQAGTSGSPAYSASAEL
jgi:hypothetical protein